MKTNGRIYSIIAGVLLTVNLIFKEITTYNGFLQILSLTISLSTIVLLFAGKQKLLIIPFTLNVLVGVFSLTCFKNICDILDYFVSALLLTTVLISTMTSFRGILKFIWLAPAIVLLITQSIEIALYDYVTIPAIIQITIVFVAYLLMGYWLTLAEPVESDGSINLVAHILLLFLTCDIWYFIWIYKTTVLLNSVPDEEKVNPVSKLLLCMLVPFYAAYWTYKSSRRIEKLAQTKGMHCNIAVLCTVLSVLVDISAPAVMQYKINKIVKEKTEAIVD